MKIEKLNHKKKKYFLYSLGIAVVLLAIFEINISLAKYKTTQSINIVKGTINYSFADFNLIAIYQENSSGTYDEVDEMPNSGYVINEDESYCNIKGVKDENAILKTSDGNHIFANLNKGSKCYLYFDKNMTASETILANKTISTRNSFNTSYTATTTNTIFSTKDDDGTSYYFAGAATDNWINFAKKYWRIIRINGDESIRIIYDGTIVRNNGTSSTTSDIGTSAFNSNYNDNAYVGYMYTIGNLRGLGTSSTIKEILDSWYDSNLANYASYIDTNAGFCGDRTAYTYSNNNYILAGGTGTTETYYGAFIRRFEENQPTLKCNNINDLYTLNISNKGNKSLNRAIGLITMDEEGYAGVNMASYTNNSEYYLYTGHAYWTMSPYVFAGGYARVFYVNSGCLNNSNVNNPGGAWTVPGIRPVINLRSDITLKGSGTTGDPYQIL